MRALLFPGQGSQKPGMGKDLAEAFSAAKAVFEEVDDALSDNLSRLMWSDDMDTLTLTENAQPALMAVSMAVIRTLEDGGQSVADLAGYVAGHSLGEYSALAATGAISLADTARLLRTRGQAMQKAVPAGEGAMAAILGLDIATVKQAAEAGSAHGVCVAANDNADGQVVISGDKAAIEAAIAAAKDLGARRAMTLPVSAPFHSPLMAPAADVMRDALAATAFKSPVVPVVTNVTAAPETAPETLKSLLVEQVTAPVRWRESVASFSGLGITQTVECGSGNVLTGMVRRIDKSLETALLGTPADIEAFTGTV